MNPRTLLLPLSLLSFGCFAPHDPVVVTGDDSGSEDDGSTGGETSVTTDAPTTSNATTTSATTSTTTDPAESSEGTPPETSTTSDDVESSTGSFPYCGDGNVDDGEECDEGDAIGPDAHCLEGCILNICGDGELDPGIEACDDGEASNVLEVGACAPDCSTVIEEKIIRLGEFLDNGDFGNNPVSFADSTCDPGYQAMFSYPDVREATTVAYSSVGAIDWTLAPYTAYVRPDGTLVWITDDVPLLGVRAGAPQPLENGVIDDNCGPCFAYRTVTGFAPDWTTRISETCSLWESTSSGITAAVGNPYFADDFIDNGENLQCDDLALTSVYCVEQ
ncbi:MAG TPA: DUF1554 domain-containing protein [Nannocystaceae bacterium]|nr:DUF1554 domain-containing protein [Nannocystaceae bacterium]